MRYLKLFEEYVPESDKKDDELINAKMGKIKFPIKTWHYKTWLISSIIKKYFNGEPSGIKIINNEEVDLNILSYAYNNKAIISWMFNLLKTKDPWYVINFIKKYKFKLFNPNGKYFMTIYDILSRKVKEGHRLERIAKEHFKKYHQDRFGDLTILNTTAKEDKAGTDFKAKTKKGIFTVQVKKLNEVKVGNSRYFIKIFGHTTELNTRYLIVVNDDEIYIFDSLNSIYKKGFDDYSLPKYSSGRNNLVYHSKIEPEEEPDVKNIEPNQLSLF